MRGTISSYPRTPAPAGALAPATRVEPEQYDLHLVARDRRRYNTNLASFEANLATALASLGINARVEPSSVRVTSDYVAANPMDPPTFTRWVARVTAQAPTTQALLHRAMARAAWHSSTWQSVESGILSGPAWTTAEKDLADGGASFVSTMDFGIEAAGQGAAGSGVAGGTAAEQSAARDLNALAQRIALLDGSGNPIVNAEVRRLQIAMGMLSDAANGRYNEDTKARMRYLGIANPAPSFRAGSSAPAPNTTTSNVPPRSTPSSSSSAATIAVGAGVVGLALWYFSRRR